MRNFIQKDYTIHSNFPWYMLWRVLGTRMASLLYSLILLIVKFFS